MPISMSSTIAVERRSLRERTVEKIRDAILDGTLQPGERLHDAELQEWLGVSRTPVREALNELARLGLVEMEAQKYTRVAEPDAASAADSLQTVGALLGGVVRVTVPTLSATATKSIAAKLDAVIKAVQSENAEEHASLGWVAFHSIIDNCKNPILVAATRDTIDAQAYRLSVTRGAREVDWPTLKAAYPELKEKLLAGDAIGAELAIELLFGLPKAGAVG